MRLHGAIFFLAFALIGCQSTGGYTGGPMSTPIFGLDGGLDGALHPHDLAPQRDAAQGACIWESASDKTCTAVGYPPTAYRCTGGATVADPDCRLYSANLYCCP
jgi:hypothetical protein